MRSIRMSLMLYVLLLLGLALVGFSYFTYENAYERLSKVQAGTNRVLTARNERTQQVLLERYLATEQTLQTSFDGKLLLKAQSFATHLAQQIARPERVYAAKVLMGLNISHQAAQCPMAAIITTQVNSEMSYGFYPSKFVTANLLDVQLVADRFSRLRNQQTPEYYQIHSEQGDLLLASELLEQDRLPLSPQAFNLRQFEPEFETMTLASGKRVRVITIRVPVVSLRVTRISIPFPGNGRNRGRPEPSRFYTQLVPVDPRDVERGSAPKILLQYALPANEVEDVLAELRDDLKESRDTLQTEQEQTLAQVEGQARAALTSLRTKLGLISLLTFLATTVGGVWLVKRGLAPLQKIADAVSGITVRNLHLPLNQRQVPQEMETIVEKLQETLGSLEKTFEREKQALADISHDLRTPIASLLATTQVSLRKQRTTEEYRAALTACAEIGRQMGSLVERLLALARLDAGVDTYKPEPVDVPELTAQCVNLVKPLAAANNLSVTFDRNGSQIVQTDPLKLREVLTNLLDNAIHYNKPGGSVHVSVARNNGHVEVAVQDTGIGIPADKQPRLFERFFRGDPSRATATIHAGLGLAIVKGYVDVMGGTVDVQSVEGEGSTFRVQLPAAPGYDKP